MPDNKRYQQDKQSRPRKQRPPRARRGSVYTKTPNLYARIAAVFILFVGMAGFATASVYALLPDQIPENPFIAFEKHEEHDSDIAEDAQEKSKGDTLGDQSVAAAFAEVNQNSNFSGWSTGLASAYGLDSNDDGALTASGVPLDDYSYTVAVPQEKSYLLGKSVDIGYDNVSLTATITDTGGFGPMGRDFDLAPGVWKAFGASSESDWGLRSIYYRFVDDDS